MSAHGLKSQHLAEKAPSMSLMLRDCLFEQILNQRIDFIFSNFKQDIHDAPTFVVSILHHLALTQDVPSKSDLPIEHGLKLNNWCMNVYHIYFKPEDIPMLYSRLYQQYISNPNDQQHLIHYSEYEALYFKRLNNLNLSLLSKYYDQINANSEINYHLQYFCASNRILRNIFRKSRKPKINQSLESIMDSFPMDAFLFQFGKVMEFLRIHHRKCVAFHTTESLHWLVMVLVLNHRAIKTAMNVGDQFAIRFVQTSQSHYKSYTSLSNREKYKMDLCDILGHYYYWYKYNWKKAMKYKKKALKLAFEKQNQDAIGCILLSMHTMDLTLGNFDGVLRWTQLLFDNQ